MLLVYFACCSAWSCSCKYKGRGDLSNGCIKYFNRCLPVLQECLTGLKLSENCLAVSGSSFWGGTSVF